MSRIALVGLGCAIAGVVVGFGISELGMDSPAPVPPTYGSTPAPVLTDQQVDALAEKIAPAVARRLTANALAAPGVQPSSTPAVSESAREAAFTRAAQVIDTMIANRRITREGLNEAHGLLRDTGQTDRGYELQARIAAAMNRGELTLEQSGFVPPGS